MRALEGFIVLMLILAAYLAPTVTAFVRKHQVVPVAIINVLLGWTVLGWIVAMAMAAGDRHATG